MPKPEICCVSEWFKGKAQDTFFKGIELTYDLKAYGIQFPGGRFKAPFEETMRLSDSESKQMWYYSFQDNLTQRSKGKQWSWCEVRPDAIVSMMSAPNSH